MAWTAVTLLTLGALLYSWVNLSGARQWRMTQEMLKAEGETLDFRAFCNGPIPDAENFCAIPLLKDLRLVVDNDERKGEPGENLKKLKEINLPSYNKRPPQKLGERTDLKMWADALRKEGWLPASADSGNPARDVLSGLAKQDALVRELAAGLNRPKAQWTPDWKTAEWDILRSVRLPHINFAISISQTLRLRGIAAARAGDAAQAHESALIISRLAQASLNDPFVIGPLVAISASSLLCDTTWELCDAHAGSVEDFTKLETALMGLDFQRAILNAFRFEMAGGVESLQFMKRNRKLGRELFDILQITMFAQEAASDDFSTRASRALSTALFYAIPSGWFDASTAVIADFNFKYIIKPLRDHGYIESRQASKDGEEQITAMKKKIWMHPSYLMATLTVPRVSGAIDKAIYSEALRNQAVIACALERYRIENGSYPDSLDGVKLANGAALPLDVVNGKPMNYRKTADGRYALWSIGFDGKDDNGQRGATDKTNPSKPRPTDAEYRGDWVRDFPSN